MERHEFINQTLKPIDRMMEVSLTGLRKANLYPYFKSTLQKGVKTTLKTQFKMSHNLQILGAENVPVEGGCILASNHQSWLDAQILAVASPRPVSFIAKMEFAKWPVLRQIMELTDTIFIRRGGDDEALKVIERRLREGACVCIFPEGTIPGEEQIPRWDVEPGTGLLRGKTGAIRLALSAQVPIVPVGVSGTGAALPPEAYPRLEMLPISRSVPIEVRFGEPLWFRMRQGEQPRYEELRGMTDRLMQAISGLVDHTKDPAHPMSAAPEDVGEGKRLPTIPFRNEPAVRKHRLGVLVLHGFTSHVNCVADLRFPLQELGVPYRIPILRGHGTRWEDLEGVKASDWYADAEAAMMDLLEECRKVVVVGLSMGGLVALDLAAHHRRNVAGVVTIAAALKFKDPLSALTPLMARLLKSWPSPKAYNDENLEKQRNANYARFPMKAFSQLYAYADEVERNLRFVEADALIIHSRKDQVIHQRSARIIHNRIASAHKSIVWFENSGHEMLLDMEAPEVLATIERFIRDLCQASAAAEGDENVC